MFSFSFPVHILDCVGSTIASLTNRQLFASTSATGIMSRTHWDDGLHAVNGTDAPEAVLPGQQAPKEPVSTRWTATYPQYSPLVRPNSPEKQDQEQSGHFLPQLNASSPGLKRKICGLRRSTFFLIVALLAVIVVAAVGGGVGGSIAVKKAKSSPPSSTAFDCAAVASSGSSITLGDKSWKFDVKCNLKFEGNVNLAASVAYSFEECLHSCAQTNWLLRNETVCDSECNTLIERLANGRWDSEFGVGSVLGMRSGIVQDVEGNHREVKAGSMLRAFSGVQLELI
ncbi:hypothetical protein NCU17137 [Neurospora crassa OR74A]|uniref:Uncharacterized protein n=1 Tax=Neurospora crassa (strain ATCC 24698 / 74-OR23-1A / CBS 708.71 / DSM 1257 / FGSC 987) TaxID=367110 RepID=V5INF8_NEUCR|nr:hypothetical protein NCU17137 [Neurospora crassa OR74A]ESA42306.1 hypothetical protein NCU17137 [Neurospora crassa OR74A]|eukprot:XP_011395104.1 hypothetical protein NCU17137 [Neurospora crassa OR74A]